MYIPRSTHLRFSVIATASSLLVACGGGDNPPAAPPAALPQLSAAVPASFAGNCADLSAGFAGLASTQITLAETVAAGVLTVGGAAVSEHCRVTGKMHERTSPVDSNTYAVGFEMRLPKNWNGRFLHQGNGGIDGSVRSALGAGATGLSHALAQGFAVLSSDGGHSGGAPYFGVDPEARLDYGYQAVSKLTPMAKQAIQLTYGKAPDRSYFAGCSNGGRHAMVAAARYFADYDGILAGAPGYNLPKAALANLAGAREYAKVATVSPVTNSTELATAVTDTERAMVANKILAKCDALDNAADGLIQDVAACQKAFNLADDVPTCSGARDGTCLTAAQKTVLKTIFDGPKTSNGTQIYASFPYDAGFAGSGVPAWEYVAAMDRDSGALGFIWQIPPANPVGFDGVNYALNTDIDALFANIFNGNNTTYTESAMSFMTPPDPTNMQGLRKRGGKIMVYHGVADPIFSVNDSETWYKGVTQKTGDNFARFYQVPGMGHCSGGPATDQFDMLTPLVNWVEKGQAPSDIVATARGAGNAGGVNSDLPSAWAPDRTRPLCAYPKVARYKGSGSLEVASSFVCQ